MGSYSALERLAADSPLSGAEAPPAASSVMLPPLRLPAQAAPAASGSAAAAAAATTNVAATPAPQLVLHELPGMDPSVSPAAPEASPSMAGGPIGASASSNSDGQGSDAAATAAMAAAATTMAAPVLAAARVSVAEPGDTRRQSSASHRSVTAGSGAGGVGAGAGAVPKAMTAFSGPTRATRPDLDAHTLPVSPLFPLHMSLTLDEFEDVLAEAIFAGANRQSGRKEGSATAPNQEKHPKEEARSRFAAAVAKARAGAVAFYAP